MCANEIKYEVMEGMEELQDQSYEPEKIKASRQKAYEWGNSSRGYCRVAHSPILCTTHNNAYFKSQGFEGFANTYKKVTKATTLSIF